MRSQKHAGEHSRNELLHVSLFRESDEIIPPYHAFFDSLEVYRSLRLPGLLLFLFINVILVVVVIHRLEFNVLSIFLLLFSIILIDLFLGLLFPLLNLFESPLLSLFLLFASLAHLPTSALLALGLQALPPQPGSLGILSPFSLLLPLVDLFFSLTFWQRKHAFPLISLPHEIRSPSVALTGGLRLALLLHLFLGGRGRIVVSLE
mmetsp:Transcript_28463/g.45331  ORF Transcript_28463/g.45331 Transcript_28463/m.45331 type:complete len:205 (-) Transcript_28463:65-679(-)